MSNWVKCQVCFCGAPLLPPLAPCTPHLSGFVCDSEYSAVITGWEEQRLVQRWKRAQIYKKKTKKPSYWFDCFLFEEECRQETQKIQSLTAERRPWATNGHHWFDFIHVLIVLSYFTSCFFQNGAVPKSKLNFRFSMTLFVCTYACA